MILASFDEDKLCRFEIRPNHSLSWRAAKVFYFTVVAVSLAIALGFTALGFWPVLPFAGAELIALGCALYACALDAERREVVSVDEDEVAVHSGRRTLEPAWASTRAWTRVTLSRPSIAWYPSRLLIRSHGTQIEVGGFLTEEERARLAGALRSVIPGLKV